MNRYAVTYTFVIDAADERSAPIAVEEYISSERAALLAPDRVELLEEDV